MDAKAMREVVKQLKGASKMHAQQAAKIERMIKKMGKSKMGRYWKQAKRWFVCKVWSFKTKSGRETEVSKMRASCQSHTDERLAKGECCQTKKSSR